MSAKPEADPQLGRTLGGQYRIEALLGAGGMGRVYRGRQLSVNRPVAIKVIAGQAPHPREWVQRFRREAEATASLSHPNSVRLFDFGVTESEELFMVMELLEGNDLARQLLAHGPLPLVAALAIARQVLLALCEAHALGITHRDIKPDNIFLASVRGADVVAKVMDFGIAGIAQAQRKSRLTGAGMIIGTPMYMSPEQAQGLRVDGKSDVYSLGVVLFEMLTGRPVFESHTAVTLLLAHVARAPMRLEEAGMQLREQSSLQTLLDRLLAKDPSERPSAAEALETVTALSARLGIAGATGSMRALDLGPAAPPATARRGTPRSAAARDARAPRERATPKARTAAPLAAADVADADLGADRQRRTGPQSSTDDVAPAGGDAARDEGTPSNAPRSTSARPRLNTSAPATAPNTAPPSAAASGRELNTSTPASAPNTAPPSAAASGRELNTSAPATAPNTAPPSAAASGRELNISAPDTAPPSAATGGFRDGTAAAASELTSDRAERAFQSARAPRAVTGAQLRPGWGFLGAAVVLSAASVLAFRWAPSVIDAAQPMAVSDAHVATPAPVPAPRTVLIESQPSAAQVLVDGQKVGTTPFQLELQADTAISVAREGYARQLVNVPYDARVPVLVKLSPVPDDKSKSAAKAPPVYSIKQESHPRIGPRADSDHERRERSADSARAQHTELRARAPQPDSERETDEHSASALSAREPGRAGEAQELSERGAPERAQLSGPEERAAELSAPRQHEPAEQEAQGAGLDVARVLEMGRAADTARAAEIAGEHEVSREPPLPAAETSRSAATRIEAVREDELAEISLDDDERAHVAQHYGLRAFGRAVARAFGRLLIPYPNRERRAALAKMPLSYSSFREARAAYKQRDVDATAFQEAVWQLRERRRQKIWTERDRYARGELTQSQYEARVDRIWDEFWGPQ